MRLHRVMLIGMPVVALVTTAVYLHSQSPEAAGRYTRMPANQLRSPVTPVKSTRPGVDEVAILRKEVASLRTELLQLQRGQGAGSDTSAGRGRPTQPDPQNVADESGAGPRRKEIDREEGAREHHARVASIDAAFRREVIDPAWSTSTSSRIQSVLSSDEVGHIQADSIDCRSESCRVELRDGGSVELKKNIPMLAVQLAGVLQNIVGDSMARPDGGVTMVLYLSRESQRTPP